VLGRFLGVVAGSAGCQVSDVTILNCDCLSLDLELVATFDTMLVDPPYREHVHKSTVSCGPDGVTPRDLGFVHLSDELRDGIAKFSGVIKRWSIIYSDVESAMIWRDACVKAKATYIRPIPWIRWSMPQLSGDRPTTGCELLTCYYGTAKGRKGWNGPGNLIKYSHEDEEDAPPLDAIEHKCLRGSEKHRTEKPLDQMLDLVYFFSEEGDTVFDPCSGSGATALACAMLGRDFVGCELDAGWVDKSTERVRLWQEEGKLSERDAERYGRFVELQKARGNLA
jgi:DNA methylase